MKGARRTFMLMPGHERHKAEKAAGLDTDAVLLDFEDGVPELQKSTAREIARQTIADSIFGDREVMVRINAVGTSHFESDIEAVSGVTLDGIYIPKVEDPAELQSALSRILDMHPGMAVFATIETALGLTRVEDIAAVTGLTGLFFGSGDFSLSTGIEISRESLLYPRARIAVAAAANGLQPVDAAYFKDVRDSAAARDDAAAARSLGFSGKVIFHPNQIEPVNAAFTPDAGQISRARKIIDAYFASAAEGRGVFLLDGEFVAVDIMLMAQRVIDRARAAGVTVPENNAEKQ